jgi:hypothetical protein
MDYMGIFVEEDTDEPKSCATCEYETAVDRAECNACAREWNASGYKRFVGWKLAELEACIR